ncbi:hypothetical protein J6590_039376 [Homalodisca vitripennis]|nr:hypothetical protein J6590_039376 [Homalodisca vitripennis]
MGQILSNRGRDSGYCNTWMETRQRQAVVFMLFDILAVRSSKIGFMTVDIALRGWRQDNNREVVFMLFDNLAVRSSETGVVTMDTAVRGWRQDNDRAGWRQSCAPVRKGDYKGQGCSLLSAHYFDECFKYSQGEIFAILKIKTVKASRQLFETFVSTRCLSAFMVNVSYCRAPVLAMYGYNIYYKLLH